VDKDESGALVFMILFLERKNIKKILTTLIITLFLTNCYTTERKNTQTYEINKDIPKFPYIIKTIPLNEFSFDIRDIITEINMTSENIVIILGWSRDGKILVFLKDVHWESYLVIDLVAGTGGSILYSSKQYPPVNLSTNPSDAITIILNIAKQYNIESIAEEIGTFPYSGIDNNIYDIIMFPEKRGELMVSGTYIYRTIYPDRRRLLGYLGGLYSLRDWYINNIVFLHTKSPFENRIAVIGIIPYGRNVLLEPIPHQIGFWGVDLNGEF
jgi:hypothetical protein